MATEIETRIEAHYTWLPFFYGGENEKSMLKTFRDLVARTSHESAIMEAKWKNHLLLSAIDEFFKSPNKDMEVVKNGIQLAKEYYRVLIIKGVIHDHD